MRALSNLLVSTITRGAMESEGSSRLFALSPLDGSRRTAIEIPDSPLRHRDPNPRGGMRGARGIAVGDGEIFVANYDTIFRYDLSWRLLGLISHPQCADIHDIALRDGRLWAASTRNDRLMEFDLDGRLTDCLNPWDMGLIEDAFRIWRGVGVGADDLRDPRTHDKAQTDCLHLNSFAFASSGDLIVSLGQVRVNGHCESALVRVGAAGGAEIVHRRSAAPVPAHNVLVTPDGSILHADTANGQVVALGSRPGQTPQSILTTGGGYTRGLCLLDDGRIAVGVQNEVWLLDSATLCNVQRILISHDPRESVHSIAAFTGQS
jgi:hypothetical protein